MAEQYLQPMRFRDVERQLQFVEISRELHTGQVGNAMPSSRNTLEGKPGPPIAAVVQQVRTILRCLRDAAKSTRSSTARGRRGCMGSGVDRGVPRQFHAIVECIRSHVGDQHLLGTTGGGPRIKNLPSFVHRKRQRLTVEPQTYTPSTSCRQVFRPSIG